MQNTALSQVRQRVLLFYGAPDRIQNLDLAGALLGRGLWVCARSWFDVSHRRGSSSGDTRDKKATPKRVLLFHGAPDRIRTYDLPVRSRALYPLSYRRVLERVMGIEPTRPAWKAGILPLNYTRGSFPCRTPIYYHKAFDLSRGI